MSPTTPVPVKIDFVSDISCPWCAIGLKSLEQAIAKLSPQVRAELHFQPFELNPDMVAEGQDIDEHLRQKYGSGPEQLAQTREMIRQRGAALGFEFRSGARSRIYNTFDAHRLLHWASEVDAGQPPGGRQHALKQALFKAYFTDGQNPGDHGVLLAAAASAGLDPVQAREVLASDRYQAEVRAAQRFYHGHGIHSVPAIIINDRHLISGGQPPEVFEQALRQIAAVQAEV